jgi:hypothetical protein
MDWFKYFKSNIILNELEKNINDYSYPYVRREIANFFSKDDIYNDTWLSISIKGLNINTFLNGQLQPIVDDSSYIVVYHSENDDPYAVPTKCLIYNDILYFKTVDYHPAGNLTAGSYYLYYNTPNIRYISEVLNGPQYDEFPGVDFQVVDITEADYVGQISDIENLTYEVNLQSTGSYNFSFANSSLNWDSGKTAYPGSKVYLSFTGPYFILKGQKGPGFSKIKVSLTALGDAATPQAEIIFEDLIIDCYSQTFEEDSIIYQNNNLLFKDYVLEITVLSDKNVLSSGNMFKVNSYRFNYNAVMSLFSEEISDLAVLTSGSLTKATSLSVLMGTGGGTTNIFYPYSDIDGGTF